MHSPAPASSASSALGHPASSTGPLAATGPHRLHALMTASTATFHINVRSALNTTRSSYTALLQHLPPALLPVTSPLLDVLDTVVSVAEDVVDEVCLVMRELADEWLVQTVEMMEEMRERQQDRDAPNTRSLPWQQQQLDVSSAAPGARQQQYRHTHAADTVKQQPGAASAGSAGSRRPAQPARQSRTSDAVSRAPSGITTPLTATHRSALPDGSVVFVSPLRSDDADFSLSSIAGAESGEAGEQRVAISLKDGLVRVTRKGGAEELVQLRQRLLDDQHGQAAASAA